MAGFERSAKASTLNPVSDPIRAMVVDDALVVRGMLSRMLEQGGDIAVVASAGDGIRALSLLERHDVEVVLLDIEMPRMDGMEALPKIVAKYPNIQIVMVSTMTARNAKISIQALGLGAADYITKPGSTGEMQTADMFKRDLLAKVRSLGRAARRKAQRRAEWAGKRAALSGQGVVSQFKPASSGIAAASAAAIGRNAEYDLRPLTYFKPDALAIGSSTGGPQALLRALTDLGEIPQPIFITQHMPATFTAILAEHISKTVGRPCEEGQDGTIVQPGRIYLAPGGHHMLVKRDRAQTVIELNDGPPENFCRPAFDPMLRSLVAVYGKRLLTTILTGMGSDGAEGCKSCVNAGGQVLAQDEASSVVWGMPGAAAMAGVCSAVLPLDKIGAELRRFALGGGHP